MVQTSPGGLLPLFPNPWVFTTRNSSGPKTEKKRNLYRSTLLEKNWGFGIFPAELTLKKSSDFLYLFVCSYFVGFPSPAQQIVSSSNRGSVADEAMSPTLTAHDDPTLVFLEIEGYSPMHIPHPEIAGLIRGL